MFVLKKGYLTIPSLDLMVEVVSSPVLIPVEVPVKLAAEMAEVQEVETVQSGLVGRQPGSRVSPGEYIAETNIGIKEKTEIQTTNPKTKEKSRNLNGEYKLFVLEKFLIGY